MKNIVDTHCHLFDKIYKDRKNEIIKKSIEKGVGIMVNVGIDLETSKKAINQATRFKEVYASIGLHPINVREDINYDELINEFKKLSKNDMVIAIGECGLDFIKAKDETLKNIQKKVFIEQLNFAKALNLPVLIHCRGA